MIEVINGAFPFLKDTRGGRTSSEEFQSEMRLKFLGRCPK